MTITGSLAKTKLDKLMTTFNETLTIATMIDTADRADIPLCEQMTYLVEVFGETALLPIKDGGLNGNAFREGAKVETEQAAAVSCGLSLDLARSLARIRTALNAHRSTLWQTYQIAYFGIDTIKPPKEKADKTLTVEETRIQELSEQKKTDLILKKKIAGELKVAKAKMTIADINGKPDEVEEAKKEVRKLEAGRDSLKEDMADQQEKLDLLKADKKAAPLADAVQQVMDRLVKSKLFGTREDLIEMTLEDILDKL